MSFIPSITRWNSSFSTCTCRNFSNLEGAILTIVILLLGIEYILFVVGAHVTTIPALCGIISGLQHYLTLVLFNWILVYSFWMYLSLFAFFGWSKQSKMRLVKIKMLLSWSKLSIIQSTNWSWLHWEKREKWGRLNAYGLTFWV